MGDQFGQTGPLHALARHDVGEHLDRAGLLQTHGLSSHVLIAGADAGITQNIAHPVRLPNGRSVDAMEGSRCAPPISVHILCLRSEEHTSELQSLMRISYAVFCLKKKKIHITKNKT